MMDWKPAIVVPEAKKAQKRYERELEETGFKCELSIEFPDGDKFYLHGGRWAGISKTGKVIK